MVGPFLGVSTPLTHDTTEHGFSANLKASWEGILQIFGAQ